jgi:hypothetical protein
MVMVLLVLPRGEGQRAAFGDPVIVAGLVGDWPSASVALFAPV